MINFDLKRYAHLLVNYNLNVKADDKVLIRGPHNAHDMMLACFDAILNVGAFPMLVWEDEAFHNSIIRNGSEEQISWVPSHVVSALKECDCLITLLASENTTMMASAPADNQKLFNKTYHGTFIKTVGERAYKGELRWVIAYLPTRAYAQSAQLSLKEYAELLANACMLTSPDPAQAWQELSSSHQKLIDWLSGKKQVQLKSPDVDLEFSIDGRCFLNSDGHGGGTMPTGEIFTGPVESSVNGWIRFSKPVYFRGTEMTDVYLKFEDGVVVEFDASKNKNFLASILDIDEGARMVGEFAVGTNPRIKEFTYQRVFDKNILGTFHIALGKSIKETGGLNYSAIHWNMVFDMRDAGKMWVDDELFFDSGQFLVG